MKVPDCCVKCRNLCSEFDEYGPPGYYCRLNIFLPTTKNSCKRKPKQKEAAEKEDK